LQTFEHGFVLFGSSQLRANDHEVEQHTHDDEWEHSPDAFPAPRGCLSVSIADEQSNLLAGQMTI
jgi:hypothetical protein